MAKKKHRTMGEDKYAGVGKTKGLNVIINAKQKSYNLEQAMNLPAKKNS